MNRRMVFYMVGQIVKIESILMILPLIVSLIYNESCWNSFLIAAVIALAVGYLLTTVFKPHNKLIYAKEGFVIVALAWITLSAIGCLPFVISGQIPSYIDAFFETVSGFTTTGASILNDVEALSKGMLFWRSFTHWVGGMGILVFVMAIIPSASDRSIHILRAEVPGPIVGKLVPRIKDTASILYLIYIAITVLEIITLIISDMPLYDSIVHSFGTAGTGGFGIKADSIASYTDAQQWIITVFMLLFGINFNLYYLLLIKRFKSIFKSGELWCYLSIVAGATGLIAINTYQTVFNGNLADTIRHSAFQVSSIITTTGYATHDFNTWPVFSKSIILILMIVGACAGSTGGGFKLSRVIMLCKSVKNELARLLHPRSVNIIKLEGKKLDSKTITSTSAYFVIYSLCAVVIFLIISALDGQFDIETNLSASISCFNNIGPGLSAVGPTASYAAYSVGSKIVLSIAMLLGRLEIYPIIIALSLSTWKKK